MKKTFNLLLCLFLVISVIPCVNNIYASNSKQEEITNYKLKKPQTPNYFNYVQEEGNHSDMFYMYQFYDPYLVELMSEYYNDSEMFYEQYDLYYINIFMQWDVSFDNQSSWQYTSQWDTEYSQGGYGNAYTNTYVSDELLDDFTFFDLYFYDLEDSERFGAIPLSAIYTTTNEYDEIFKHYDYKNHNLYIRCRYFLEYETNDAIGERVYKTSEWSDVACLGKNSTQIKPEAKTYEAPVLSNLKFEPPNEEYDYLRISFEQKTPASVWKTQINYLMNDGDTGEFDGLEAQMSINGSEWFEVDVIDSWGDWCLYDGYRVINDENDNLKKLSDSDNVKFRARFMGTHGPSPWSKVVELNGDGMNFADVKNINAWFYSSVKKAFDKGLMGATGKAPNEYGEPYFEPDAPITRAMVATVLHRMAGKVNVQFKANFSDVTNASLWYASAVTWAAQNKVVSGYKDGRFGPDDNITRQDLAIMLRNYGTSKGLSNDIEVDFSYYKDGSKVDSYAASAVAWCIDKGLMSGAVKKDGTYLNPKNNASRAECAKMFSLLDDAINKLK